MKLNDYNYYIRFRKRIEDLIEDFGTIFSNMATRQDAPEWLSNYTASMLDLEFEGLYSGRWLNKLSAGLYSIVNDEIQKTGNISTISELLLQTYRTKWDKLFYLYSLEMGKIDEEGVDYNPIENYSSYEITTYNQLKDSLIKSGVERQSQKSQVKQAPMKTVTRVTDEYGTLESGEYKNGIKDKTEYSRKYKTTDESGKTENGNEKPFVTTDEKGIAGLNSSGNYGAVDAGDIPASGGVTGYSQSDMNIHTELGEKSSTFEDVETNSKKPYESTERTGKHTSASEFGGEIQNGSVVQGKLQITSELDPTLNYTELSFRPDAKGEQRKDENTRSGSFTVEKSGNIGVMTASQMIESAWDGELTRNFILQVLRDSADLISLKCY